MTNPLPSPFSAPLWLAAGAVTLAHLMLVAMSYPQLPSVIPAFVDLAGQAILVMPKSPLAAFRLPLMGLLLQAICWRMSRVALPRAEDTRWNQVLWPAVALVAGAKALLSTLDFVPHGASVTPFGLRGTLLAVSALGVAALIVAAYRLFSAYDREPLAYVRQLGHGPWRQLAGLLVLYVGLVLLPFLVAR